MKVGGYRHGPVALPLGKRLVPNVQEAGWVPRQVGIGAENFAPHRDSIHGPSIS